MVEICPVCGKYVKEGWWAEFGNTYHLDCLKELEKKGKPFHENYANQKRVPLEQVKEVLDLLADADFLEYWLHVYACNSEKEVDELYSHPLLEEFDLLP